MDDFVQIFSKTGRKHCSSVRILLQPINEVWGKVMFSQACVIPSLHSWRGGANPQGRHPPCRISTRGGGQTPWTDTPPWADTLRTDTPPWVDILPRPLKLSVRILTECILVFTPDWFSETTRRKFWSESYHSKGKISNSYQFSRTQIWCLQGWQQNKRNAIQNKIRKYGAW